ncbi:hypothetical protein JYU34_003681 [Plutella xylostella]|uniref:MICOS complex subunit MIC19 n=1 Tax=Plutella xylostella TaxID=51655 RepID=A0ABQ7R0N3_PLUXY|nr:uncharacterized protein LOC105382576 isoform X2 [Plutella xylostella]KAG7310850.1 hypothetical protein JYU34_003681 [Plutella xylostella]
MGGSQSTRKLSVDNDNSIQVSQEALDRIQSQLAAKASQPPPPQYAAPQYPAPPYYESRRPQQEHSSEEAYWNRRIEDLKKAHEKISATMQLEYQKTLKEANELFNSVNEKKVAIKTAPCQEEKAKVLQCYKANPDKSLLCSVLVNQFNDCVCKSRVAAVSATS